MKTILVMSGKGGVGKTTIATAIARFLSDKKIRTGIIDADIHGPNVFEMLKTKKINQIKEKIIPVDINDYLQAVSIASFVEDSNAVIWRGPMKHKFIKQLLEDVAWKELDYLIIDFPPGTGDEHLSVAQLLKEITGAVIVSSPQKVALSDVRRAVDFCRKLKIPLIGAVENMSGGVFGEGLVKPFCDDEKIEFLGTIALSGDVVEGKEGFYHDSSLGFDKVIEKIINF